MKEKEISNRNTKAEILEAYEEALTKLKEKQKENPKIQQVRQEEEIVSEKAFSENQEAIVRKIAELRLSLSSSLDKLSDELVNEYSHLQNIRKATGIEQKKLEDTYQLSTQIDSLAAVVMAQKEKEESFEQEMKNKKEEFEQDLKTQKDNFNEEMNQMRTAWDKEKADMEETLTEEKQKTEKARKREEEEYTYQVKQKRQKEQDIYETKKAQQERELSDHKAAFEAEIAEREKTINAKEAEYLELKSKAENFPKQLDEAVNQAVRAATEKLKLEYKYEKDLMAKDTDREIKLRDLQIDSLQQKIRELEQSLKQIAQKSDSSEKTVKEIAIKAIENSGKVGYAYKSVKNTEEKED